MRVAELTDTRLVVELSEWDLWELERSFGVCLPGGTWLIPGRMAASDGFCARADEMRVRGADGAFTGDGLDASIMAEACEVVARLGGAGVPTVKPWDAATMSSKLDQALAARPAAVAMDIDAAGLPFLRGQQPPAGAMDATQVAEVAARCHEAGVPSSSRES